MPRAPRPRRPSAGATSSSAAAASRKAEQRLAVYGSTEDEPESHFIAWRDDVDPDELFASGQAWGLNVVRVSAGST